MKSSEHEARRLPPLQGGRNFRDLGGYRTHDGRRVRWGRLYRSGSLAALTDDDCRYLRGLGIRWVCDLRTTHERQHAPSAWCGDGAPLHWSRDYVLSFGDLRQLLGSGSASAAGLRARMLDVYRELPFEQAPAYRELFRRLADGELPLIFNCSAGKDRTGVAAALILSVLGVPRDIVVGDYVLSATLLAGSLPGGAARAAASLDPALLAPIMGSEPDYLHSAFAAIEARHGDIDSYLREALALGAQDLQRIREALLE